jgi:hypothetical protein
MDVADLKTAAEVRAHARQVQRRINSSRRVKPEPKPEPPPPAPPLVVIPAPPKPKLPTFWSRPLDDELMRGFPLKAVLRGAAQQYGLTFGRMRSPARDQVTCAARQAAIFVAVHLLRASFSSIGRAFHRDHSTILHDMRLARERLANADEVFAARIDAIGYHAATLLGRKWHSVRAAADDRNFGNSRL